MKLDCIEDAVKLLIYYSIAKKVLCSDEGYIEMVTNYVTLLKSVFNIMLEQHHEEYDFFQSFSVF